MKILQRNFRTALVTDNARGKLHPAASAADRDQDRKIAPPPGTNHIAGFGSSCPLARLDRTYEDIRDLFVKKMTKLYMAC